MMKQARNGHGCALANFKGSMAVFVVGGYSYGNYLDSVEVLNLKENKWKALSSRLPFPLGSLKVVAARSPMYHIYAVGGKKGKREPVATIYGMNKSEKWDHVGDLKLARWGHSTINMQLKDIPGCQ